MINDLGYLLSEGNVKLLAEAAFWMSIIFLSPVIFKVAYYITAPLWVKLFPAKFVELQYTIEGKQYCATVKASDNLSHASSTLRKVAEQKHWKLNE